MNHKKYLLIIILISILPSEKLERRTLYEGIKTLIKIIFIYYMITFSIFHILKGK